MTSGVVGPRCVGIARHPRRVSAQADGVAVPWRAGIAHARLVVVTSTRLIGVVGAGLDGIVGRVAGSECLENR